MANTIVWFDLPVANLEKATKFYSAVLGIELKIVSEHGFEMTVFPHEDCDVAGCLYQSAEFIPHQSGLLIYFNVNDKIQHAVSQVERCGGKVVEAVNAVGPWGYRAIVLDSEGNKIALYSKDMS